MTASSAEATYKVWAVDNMVYGPIRLPVLAEWVHSQVDNAWRRAMESEVLREIFNPKPPDAPADWRFLGSKASPDEFRQFDLFITLSDADLEQFIRFGELVEMKTGEVVIHKGDPGDSVFFVLSGEVRARLLVGLEQTVLCRIPAGEFFGEMSMFNQSARSADVITEVESRLFRVSAEAFLLLIKQLPRLAAPILFGIARTMTNRITAANFRLQGNVAAEFVWR